MNDFGSRVSHVQCLVSGQNLCFLNFHFGDLQLGSHPSPTPLGCALISSAFNNIRHSTWQARALAKQTKQVDEKNLTYTPTSSFPWTPATFHTSVSVCGTWGLVFVYYRRRMQCRWEVKSILRRFKSRCKSIYDTSLIVRGPGSSASLVTGYGWTVRGSIPVSARFIFRTSPDRPWGPPSLLYNGYRVFPGVKSGRGVTLNPHPLLVPWSWKGRAIPLLPLWAIRPVQSLSDCTRVHFTFFTW